MNTTVTNIPMVIATSRSFDKHEQEATNGEIELSKHGNIIKDALQPDHEIVAAAALAAWSCLSKTRRSRRHAACAAANDLSSSPTLSPAALLRNSSLAATSAFNWCSRAATRLWRARSQAAALPPVRTVYWDLNVSGEPKGGGDGRLLV